MFFFFKKKKVCHYTQAILKKHSFEFVPGISSILMSLASIPLETMILSKNHLVLFVCRFHTYCVCVLRIACLLGWTAFVI